MGTPKDLWPRFTELANSVRGRYAWQYVKSGIASQSAFVGHFDVERNGVPIRATPLTGSKGTLLGANFLVRVRKNPVTARTTLRRETGIDRLGKRFGINREFHLGDANFDHAVYIDSDAQDATLAHLFETLGIRASILRILGAAPVEISLHPDPLHAFEGAACLRISVDLKDFSSPPMLELVLAASAELALECDRTTGPALGPYGRGSPMAMSEGAPLPIRKGRSLVAAALLLPPPMIALVAPDGRSFGWTLTLCGLGLGFVLWSCLVVLFARMFRGRSSSLRTSMALWLCALGVVPFGVTLLEQANALLDDGPVTTRDAFGHMVRPSKGPTYVVVRATWISGEPTGRYNTYITGLSLDQDVPLQVATRSGALGVPWIVSVGRP